MRSIVPVRIDGPERSPFGYLRAVADQEGAVSQDHGDVPAAAPSWMLDPALKGKARRQAAGLALQDIMVEAAVETARIDRTLFAALVGRARRTRDTGKPAVADPLGTQAQLPQADPRRAGAGPQARRRCAAPGAAVGVMLPNSAGVASRSSRCRRSAACRR